MLGLGLWSLWARWRGTLRSSPWLHRAAILMGPTGFVAVLAGWVTTEVGRQPFTVYGLLRTAESASPLKAPAVAASLVAFVLVYFAVFGAGTLYILKLMSHAPHRGETEPGKDDASNLCDAGADVWNGQMRIAYSFLSSSNVDERLYAADPGKFGSY